MSQGKENINLISKYQFINKIDCFIKCTSLTDCVLVWINSNLCYLYNKIDLTNFVYLLNSVSLMEKYKPDYSSINPYLTNYWPFNNDYRDIVSGAHMFGGGGSISFTKDRLNTNNGALYLNNAYLQVPSGIYFKGDFTITVWVKLHQISAFSRVIDFGNGQGSDNIILGFNQGNTANP